jgi:hypothetical protein
MPTELRQHRRGNASVCPSQKFILLDNLTAGFDLYNMARTSPVRTFSIPTTRRYVKKGVFAEQASAVVCASDHGLLYIFRSNSEELIQTLHHDGGGSFSVWAYAGLIQS